MKKFGEKIESIEYIRRPGVYGIVFNSKGQVGLIKAYGSLYLPGGGIEGEESEIDCLHREFLEETGLNVKVLKSHGSAVFFNYIDRLETYYELMGSFYSVEIIELTDKKIEMDHEFDYYDLDQAINQIKLPHQRWALEEMRKV